MSRKLLHTHVAHLVGLIDSVVCVGAVDDVAQVGMVHLTARVNDRDLRGNVERAHDVECGPSGLEPRAAQRRGIHVTRACQPKKFLGWRELLAKGKDPTRRGRFIRVVGLGIGNSGHTSKARGRSLGTLPLLERGDLHALALIGRNRSRLYGDDTVHGIILGLDRQRGERRGGGLVVIDHKNTVGGLSRKRRTRYDN